MPAILPTLPTVTVPVPTVLFPTTGIARPGHDMSHAWRDVLITSRTDIKLRGGGAANVAHNERFAVGPFRALDCLGTEEGGSVLRKRTQFRAITAVATWH
ncbi:hypothetical protein AZH46_09270 [Corynebacterium striatum]|nr:hypothetical protein AZH46_09270 [Corynebacterium striatum]